MPKVNVNAATREELVETAGLRSDLADAILKFRGKHGDKITDVQALEELPGVGPATIEQLRKSLDFSERRASNGDDKYERADNGARRAAQERERTVRETAEKTADVTASAVRSTAEAGRDAAGRARAVCDYIGGMTDRFAIEEHRRLFTLDVWA